MKKMILDKIRKSIVKQYPDYTKDKIDEIMYGLEGIYLTITKTIIIFFIAILFGIQKELLILLVFFNFIRLFAFGMHANSSISCLLFSSLLFLGGAALIKYINIDKYMITILFIISFIIISIFAPSDTEKRPLIKKAKRIRFKFLSCTVVIIYFVLSILIKSTLVTNSLVIGLLIECILISPTTYKLFKIPYNNYKRYGLNTR